MEAAIAGAQVAAAHADPSVPCVQALAVASKNRLALERAKAGKDAFTAAGDRFGISPSILAAIAIRESGVDTTAVGGAGSNYKGAFQMHTRNRVPADLPAQAVQAAALLNMFIEKYSDDTDDSAILLNAALRNYNGASGTARLLSNGKTALSELDKGTNGGNYVSNIRAIAENCFGTW